MTGVTNCFEGSENIQIVCVPCYENEHTDTAIGLDKKLGLISKNCKNSFNLAGLENVWQNCREFMRMCHPKDLHNEKKCATKTHLVLFI